MGVSAAVNLPLHHKVQNGCGVVVVLSTKIAVPCCQKSVSIQGVKAQRVAKHAIVGWDVVVLKLNSGAHGVNGFSIH